MLSVATGRASRRLTPISSPVSRQYPYEPSSMRLKPSSILEVPRLILHVRDRAVDLDHEVALPAVENTAEVLELLLAHVQLAALDDVRLYVARTGEQASRP